MSAVLDVIVSVSKDGTVEINKVKKSADEAEKSTKKLSGATENLSHNYFKMAKNIAVTVAGLYAVKKGVELITSSVVSFTNTSAQFEKYETTLTSITGSSEKAKESMAWITDFTANTPFQLNQVTEGFVKMKAYGLDPMDRTLKTLGDTASAMGKDINQAVEAMADAVTGENERLKEFGVKASLQGEKVAYSWSDSSGKMRNIVVDNNKKVIQSTLNAIFNEKYIGAMDAQSKTWDGMVSNLADRWTLFKKSIMDEGLFTYFKAILGVVGDMLGGAFNDAKNDAKSFSDGVIGGIESIIVGVGNMYDVWNGIKLTFNAIKIAFFGLVSGVGEGINAIAKGWDSMTVALHNGFKGFIDGTGTAFYYLVNKLLSGVNTLVNGASQGLGGIFEFIGASNPFGTINLSIGEYTSKIATAKEKTGDLIDTSWSNGNLQEALKEANRLVGEIAGEEGKAKALQIVDQIRNKVDQLTASEVKSNKEKENAKKHLDDIGAGYGSVADKAKKLSSAEKKAKRDQQRADKEAQRALKDYNERFANDFYNTFDSMLHGDLMGSFDSFFGGVSDTLMTPFIDDMSKKMSSGLSDIMGGFGSFGSFLGGGLLSLGASLLGGLLNDTVSQAEIDASRGRVEFDDTSLANLGNIFESVQNPLLKVTNEMKKHIRNMDANFYSVARALNSKASNSGIDLTGVNFVDTMESGFLGFSSKSVSLIGSGLKFAVQDLGDAMDDSKTRVQAYTTTLVEESSWWGLDNDSSIKETYKNLPPEVVKDIANSFSEGFNAILTAGVSLGLDETNLENVLKDSKIDLGKIDFTGLSPQEVSDRLSDVFSTALSGVVDGVAEFTPLIERYAKGTEYSLETLIRVSTEYDQANHLFDLIGATFNEGLIDVTRTWSETVEVESEKMDGIFGIFGTMFSSGLNALSSKLGDVSTSFVGGLGSLWSRLRGGVETVTRQMSETTTEAYTRQMQILDVVESAGGLQQFSDSMSVFMDKFYTEEEKLGFMTKSMEESFATLGLEMPKTNDEFKALYMTLLSSGTEEGAYLAGQVINLADSFSTLTDATENLNEATKVNIDDINSFLTGKYSFLTAQGKTDYANMMLEQVRAGSSVMSEKDASFMVVEQSLKTARTEEEYNRIAKEHLEVLIKDKEKDNPNKEVVLELKNVRSAVEDLEITMRRAII